MGVLFTAEAILVILAVYTVKEKRKLKQQYHQEISDNK
jgi:hypothetical protein